MARSIRGTTTAPRGALNPLVILILQHLLFKMDLHAVRWRYVLSKIKREHPLSIRRSTNFLWFESTADHTSLPTEDTLNKLRRILGRHIPDIRKGVFLGPFKGGWVNAFRRTGHFEEIAEVDAVKEFLSGKPLDPYGMRARRGMYIYDEVERGVWDRLMDSNRAVISYELTPLLSHWRTGSAIPIFWRMLSFPASIYISHIVDPYMFTYFLRHASIPYYQYSLPVQPKVKMRRKKAILVIAKPGKEQQKAARELSTLLLSSPIGKRIIPTPSSNTKELVFASYKTLKKF